MIHSIPYSDSALEIWPVVELFKCLGTGVQQYLYSKNRVIDQDRVSIIADNIKSNPKLLDGTQVHFALLDNKYIILDGQHRLSASEQCLDLLKDIDIKIEVKVYNCRTLDEVHTRFIALNNNYVPVPKNYIDADRNKKCKSVSDMLSKYFDKSMFSKSYHCRRPHINATRFIERLSNCSSIDEFTSKQIFDQILKYNRDLAEWDILHFMVEKTPHELGVIKKAHKKALVNGCYLGMKKDCLFLEDIRFKPQTKIKLIKKR